MPETKEKPNQNTMFSTSTQPPKTADTKAEPAADGKKLTEPPKAPDAKATPAADAKKPAEPPKTPDTKTTPAADAKKPAEPPKTPDTKTAPAADGKKPAEPPKTPDAKTAAADDKKSAELPKAPDGKAIPAADGKKPTEPPKAPDGKKSTEPPKAPDDKAAPAADGKKPTEPPKTPDTKAAPAADGKKPTEPPKTPDGKTAPAADAKKPTEPPKAPDTKATPAADGKKPAEPPKAPDAKPAPAADGKKPTELPKAPDGKTTPAADDKGAAGLAQQPKSNAAAAPHTSKIMDSPKASPGTAPDEKTGAAKETASGPDKGVKITQIFADRLERPDDKALKDLPIPKEGEGFSIRLHPAYFFDFLDHPFTVNREVDDYKELYDSIKANGINEPVKARPREGGGLELISGHRRHDIAQQLNYPVPVIIEQVDTNDAQIECVDGNLHRQDIPTSELARAAKMKMEALARKAGRRSKMDQLTGPSKRTDQIVAEDMGMSRNQVNRLVRIDSLVPELKKQVDDKKLPFNTAVELSYLKPEEQGKVVDFMKKEETVPTLAQATQLKEASKAAQAAEKTAAKSAPDKPASQAPKTPPQAAEKKPAPVDEKKIASIVKPKAEPEQKYTFTSTELKEYFPNDRLPTTSEVKRKVFDALDLQKRAQEREKSKQALKDSLKSPAR